MDSNDRTTTGDGPPFEEPDRVDREPATDGLDDHDDPGPAGSAGPERSFGASVVAVVAIVAAAGGFIGGAAWKGSGSNGPATQDVAAGGTGTANGANLPSGAPGAGGYGFPGGGGFPGGYGFPGGGAGRFGNGTIGQITALGADTITVQSFQGDEVVVKVSSDTTIEVDGSAATVDDLATGETVVVQGTTGDDGAIAATAIRSGAFGGGPGGAPGGATATTN